MKSYVHSFRLFESMSDPGFEWYYGIADCHGIESFIKAPSDLDSDMELDALGLGDMTGSHDDKVMKQTLGMLKMRCHYNQQRHPLIYMVRLSDEDAETVQALYDNGEYIEALETIKERSTDVKVAKGIAGGDMEKRWRMIPNPDLDPMSESLQYHINNQVSIVESIYRPTSQAHFELLAEARRRFDTGSLLLEGIDRQLFEETDLGKFAEYEGESVPLDFLFEAEYSGKQVELNKPMRGGAKKYHVYVMNPTTKKVRKIAFGDVHGGLTAKVSNPEARKSFAARHRCHLKNDKQKAGYWACRINRYSHLWGGKTYPGFW
jgi:hypothetical protein